MKGAVSSSPACVGWSGGAMALAVLVVLACVSGEAFGEARLKTCLDGHRDEPAADLLERILDDVSRHAGESGFTDDVCLASVELTRRV